VKIDIAKAFDTVSWTYLLRIMEHMGFSRRWLNWISLWLDDYTVSWTYLQLDDYSGQGCSRQSKNVCGSRSYRDRDDHLSLGH
jgi:hypothetical protein